jgi:acyl-CoA reductase-like NAD-dependent aldehyde dehydrogenase
MLRIVNPYTLQLLQEVPVDTEASIKQKATRAALAFNQWRLSPLVRRMEIIGRFRVLLEDRAESLAELLSQEMGKPIQQALNEIKGTQGRLDFFLQNIESALKGETFLTTPANEEKMTWEPLGVIANISAWNYPFFVGTNVFIPAILTGNTVLYKPSEYSTLTGLQFEKLLKLAGLPDGVFSVVVGTSTQGEILLKQNIQGVFFTGSHQTGKVISQMTAGRFIKTQFELGGKDPVYVRPDANVKVAAEGLADGAFYNTGQSCCSVERIYVHEEVYQDFNYHFLKTVNNFKLGDPSKSETYIGPLTRHQQIEILKRQVADALSKGAQVLTGGKVWSEHSGFFEPTVLTKVDHSMQVMMEESFGPIIGIQGVRSDDEAIQLMNDSSYGLTAGVYTADREEAEGLLEQLDAGSVYWNCCDRVSPRLPWTGRKGSGMGSTLSLLGIRSFLQPKAWHLVY